MASNRVLRGDTTIWAAYPEAFSDPSAPTVAEMANASLVFDISCAVEDGYTLNASSSDTDDSMSICDTGDISTPTFANYEASIDTFADEDPLAAGVYNLARDLFRAKNNEYFLIKRLNIAQGTAALAGHVLYLYKVKTDNQQMLIGRGEAVMYGNRFKPMGEIYENVEVQS